VLGKRTNRTNEIRAGFASRRVSPIRFSLSLATSSGVYHFSPLCNLTRQREYGIADTGAKKGPPLAEVGFLMDFLFYSAISQTSENGSFELRYRRRK
jgi:hypothetical protein